MCVSVGILTLHLADRVQLFPSTSPRYEAHQKIYPALFPIDKLFDIT